MPSVISIDPATPPNRQTWDGTIVEDTAQRIVIVETISDEGRGGSGQVLDRRIEYIGAFARDGDDIVGVLNAINEFRDDVLIYSIEGRNVDAEAYFEAVQDDRDVDLARSLLEAPVQPPVMPPIVEPPVEGGPILGTPGFDNLVGTDGDDVFNGMGGGDLINGGGGVDTAQFAGRQGDYVLVLRPDRNPELYSKDFNGFPEPSFVTDVELLDFGTNDLGGPFDLRVFSGIATLSEVALKSFVELYIAYFNRAPDAIGLAFWGTAFANGTTLEEMASLFVDQDETRAAYPTGTSTQAFVQTVYTNVLGRTPDQIGVDFWVAALNTGAVSRDQFIFEIIRGAKSELKFESGQGFVDLQLADRAFLANKVEIGIDYALLKGMSDTSEARDVMSRFDGSSASFQTAINTINSYLAQDGPGTGDFRLQVLDILPYYSASFVETEVVQIPFVWNTTGPLEQAAFFLLDEASALAGVPQGLNTIDVYGLRFEITNPDGTETDVVLEADAANQARTHQGFVDALQPSLNSLIVSGVLPPDTTLELLPTLTETTLLDNGSVSPPIPAMVLSTRGGDIDPEGFSRIDNPIGEFDTYDRFVEDPLIPLIDTFEPARLQFQVLDQEASFGLAPPLFFSTGYLTEVVLLEATFFYYGERVEIDFPVTLPRQLGSEFSFFDLEQLISRETQAAISEAGITGLTFSTSFSAPVSIGVSGVWTLPVNLIFNVPQGAIVVEPSGGFIFASNDANGNGQTDVFGQLLDNADGLGSGFGQGAGASAIQPLAAQADIDLVGLGALVAQDLAFG
ncbi:MAG: DUF4214 domain-containing protein [Pseudomonadota bacterium]